MNPSLDLPEVEENAVFNVDVYIGGDKIADAKLALSDVDFALRQGEGEAKKIN